MKLKSAAILVTALLSLCAFRLLPAYVEDGAQQLAQSGVWKMRYDSKLDGQVADKDAGEVRWQINVRNNRISGYMADLKDGEASAHGLAGEIVDGKPPIIFLRQDGPNGLVCFYSGKRAETARIVGTWFDNRGKSGDFDMTIEKK